MYIKVSRVRLYYEEYGSGAPIIMLHGWNENRTIFKFQIEDLSKNYRVITIDLRGHGKSSKPRLGYSYSRIVIDIKRFLDIMNIRNPIIVGHSLGGQIALEYYLKYNNCNKLVLISSPYMAPTQLSGIIRMGEKYLSKKLRSSLKYASEVMKDQRIKRDSKESDDESRSIFSKKSFQVPFYVTIGLSFSGLSFNIENKLKDIKIPVLILAGEKDDLIPISVFEKMADKIPNCKLIKFENCGHFSFIEEVSRVNKNILEFLND